VKSQKLAKLQTLLERVQSRAAGSRGVADGVAAPALAAVAVAPAVVASRAVAVAPPAAPAPVVVREASYIDDSVDLPTWPPPPMPANPPVLTNGEPSSEPDISIDVELSEPPPPVEEDAVVAEAAAEDGVGLAVDEGAGATGSESVERLMAASPAPQELAIDVVVPVESERPPAVDEAVAAVVVPEVNAASNGDVPSYDLADAALDADAPPSDGETQAQAAHREHEEDAETGRAPASSRRPVAPVVPDEPLAHMAFDADESRPPRHTPPPESGRLPASPVQEFDADVTGVRTAPQPLEPSPDSELVDVAARALVPEPIRAELSSSVGEIADVIGEAQAFAPATFAAWLDETLAL
jgi:hypothetical protein